MLTDDLEGLTLALKRMRKRCDIEQVVGEWEGFEAVFLPVNMALILCLTKTDRQYFMYH
ncbi:hypothetical protein [Cyanobium sp. Morenito 9A2]|uniref:hypothetical protein n=1 Tax=Cyanobium sp. Morenito 9A2 TaxID=2823718 RepID=UPI0020CE2110|nr:hypothetical protein [Cyanobium sp. Morenito 9A2]